MTTTQNTAEKPAQNESQTRSPQYNDIIIDFLNKSLEFQQSFRTYFKVKNQENPLSSLITYLETVDPKPISQLPFKPSNINEFYNFSAVELISYLENLNLQESEKQSIIEGFLAYRILQATGLKIQEISFDDQKIHYLKKPNQLTAILKEIINAGSFENWDMFYRLAETLPSIKTIEDLNNFSQNLENQKQLFSQDQEKIYQRLQTLIQRKKESLLKQSKKEESPTQPDEKELIRQYKKYLEQSLSYLEWAYASQSPLKFIPEFVIKILEEYRNLLFTPTPETYRLAQLFWALRVNRQIDLSRFPPLVAKFTERFFKAVLDKSLQTEQAGFWIEKNLQIPQLSTLLLDKSPESQKQAIFSIIRSFMPLIKSLPNFKNKQTIYININIDDFHIFKLKIDLNSEIPIENQIEEQFSSPLSLSHDPDNLFALKQETYRFASIDKKSKEFQQFFGHQEKTNFFGIPTPFEKTISDDFSIRINTHPEDNPSSSPTSLFMVEHHHALFNFDIFKQGIKVSGKFAHRHFDGIPAKNFFNSFIANLRSEFKKTEDIPLEKIPEVFYQGEFPVFEASSTRSFSEILAEPKEKFNPTLIYALAVAITNDIDHFHFLVNGPDLFSKDGPYSNVQPVIISFLPIKDVISKIKQGENLTEEDRKKIDAWKNKTLEEIERAKKGFSTPAVIAAPVGTLQEVLSKISRKLYKAVDLLTETQGMFSGIPDLKPKKLQQTAFFTAQSDSYHLEIDLTKTQIKNSIGVVGFNQSQQISPDQQKLLTTELVFSVRKNPSQAQKEFKDWFLENFGENRNLLRKFNQLIKNWDLLMTGKIRLEDYQSSLNIFFQSMPEEKRKQFGSSKILQKTLNQILFQSCQNTLENIEEGIPIVEKLLSY